MPQNLPENSLRKSIFLPKNDTTLTKKVEKKIRQMIGQSTKIACRSLDANKKYYLTFTVYLHKLFFVHKTRSWSII